MSVQTEVQAENQDESTLKPRNRNSIWSPKSFNSRPKSQLNSWSGELDDASNSRRKSLTVLTKFSFGEGDMTSDDSATKTSEQQHTSPTTAIKRGRSFKHMFKMSPKKENDSESENDELVPPKPPLTFKKTLSLHNMSTLDRKFTNNHDEESAEVAFLSLKEFMKKKPEVKEEEREVIRKSWNQLIKPGGSLAQEDGQFNSLKFLEDLERLLKKVCSETQYQRFEPFVNDNCMTKSHNLSVIFRLALRTSTSKVRGVPFSEMKVNDINIILENIGSYLHEKGLKPKDVVITFVALLLLIRSRLGNWYDKSEGMRDMWFRVFAEMSVHITKKMS